jgi:uncharacterized membrane protein YqjE
VADGTPSGSRRGLRGAAARLAAGLVGFGRTRLELAAVDFDEARARASQRFVLVLVAGVCFGFALLAATTLVVVFFWDTHRLVALCGAAIAYALIGLAALWRLAVHRKTDAPAFAATLAELERDRAWLASRFEDDR